MWTSACGKTARVCDYVLPHVESQLWKKIELKLNFTFSFGYCDKVDSSFRPVGKYGNGFKSGSMRMGKDSIVFTKTDKTMSVGFLSQSYLKSINAHTVLVPIISWDTRTSTI